ncbi:MAG: cytochrome-c peroxidase [Leptospirillia bacterium]
MKRIIALSVAVLVFNAGLSERGMAQPLVPLPPSPPVPLSNLQTPAKVALGKKLFFDPKLSVNGSISCAFCHMPKAGYADPRPVSIGVGGKRGGRNAPSVLNAAYLDRQFWDGRAGSLEEQAIGPLTNPVEMENPTNQSVVDRLRKIPFYSQSFREIFGGDVSIDRIGEAIAAYERTLLTPNTPYDRYLMGEKNALSPSAKKGFLLFKGKARCALCHSGALLSDQAYHNLGVPQTGTLSKDVGRYAISHNPNDMGKFRTSPLRNIALTSPYMHDGTFRTLREVVDFFDKGGGKSPYKTKDPIIRPLHLTKQEKIELVDFLLALSGETPSEKNQP